MITEKCYKEMSKEMKIDELSDDLQLVLHSSEDEKEIIKTPVQVNSLGFLDDDAESFTFKDKLKSQIKKKRVKKNEAKLLTAKKTSPRKD
jgi:hypothetical protein